jgi:1-acyl-sn-glycerol-3-phosphate acyltransferase
MSKKIIYAKHTVVFKDHVLKGTCTVSEEIYKELQETRFFRHGVLLDVKAGKPVKVEKPTNPVHNLEEKKEEKKEESNTEVEEKQTEEK